MENKPNNDSEYKFYDEDLEIPMSQLLRKNWKYIVGGIIGVITLLILIFPRLIPGLIVLFVMAVADDPNNFRLPYNGIDFQKIAYIDNQFIMYGIDYEHYATDKSLVIFNSQDGKKWDKSIIKITDKNQWQPISVVGTFNYFKGKCYLIGTTVQPLVADDCKHWQTQPINQIESNTRYLYLAHSSAVANNTLYVGGNHGVYKTSDGINWSKEQLPYPEESNSRNFENSFYSMAVGNNKLITETNWRQNQKRRGLIYTKNLTTNQWSYEVYPVPVGNITRGKDRFVGLTESSAVVLEDGGHQWNISLIEYHTNLLVYAFNTYFVGVSGYLYIEQSINGFTWKSYAPKSNYSQDRLSINDVVCNEHICTGIGNNYYVVITHNFNNWSEQEFNHRHPKPHWWRRFVNF